jgi:hypothetical protein
MNTRNGSWAAVVMLVRAVIRMEARSRKGFMAVLAKYS